MDILNNLIHVYCFWSTFIINRIKSANWQRMLRPLSFQTCQRRHATRYMTMNMYINATKSMYIYMHVINMNVCVCIYMNVYMWASRQVNFYTNWCSQRSGSCKAVGVYALATVPLAIKLLCTRTPMHPCFCAPVLSFPCSAVSRCSRTLSFLPCLLVSCVPFGVFFRISVVECK